MHCPCFSAVESMARGSDRLGDWGGGPKRKGGGGVCFVFEFKGGARGGGEGEGREG